MPLLPVAAREARLAARSRAAYAWRMLIVGIGIVLIPTVLRSNPNSPSQGATVFMVLSTMAFVYAAIGGALRTADTLAEEKRENTLGLLFLTDLKVGDVLTGKLLASTATLFFGLLAFLPLLAIPVLLGGVSSQQLLLVSLNLVNTLFLSISWGLLISAGFRQAWATISLSLLIMVFLMIGVPQLTAWLYAGSAEELFPFSPLIGHLTALGRGAPGEEANFWQCLAVNHIFAWLNIFLTAHLLPQAWKEIPRSKRAEAWWNRWQRLRFGGSQTRAKFRKRLLNANPLYWLSGREQVSSGGLMAVMMLIVVASGTIGFGGILGGLLLLHIVLLVRMSSAASHTLAEDRKSGALELLLATSLSVREVLRGRWMALGRQFFGPMLIVLCWHLFSLAWVSLDDPLREYGFLILWGLPAALLAWVTTGWCGMWFGLRARHPVAAIWGTVGAILLAPWLAMAAFYSLLTILGLNGGFSGPATSSGGWTSVPVPASFLETNAGIVSTGFLLWCLYLWALSAWCGNRIRERFREAAADRFNDTQPFDWTPVRRISWRFGVSLVVLLALILGWRTFVNFRGERALREALAAYPNFTLEEPEPPLFPTEQNLARWDFLATLNDVFSQVVLRPGQRTSLKQIIMNGFAEDDVLSNWRTGRTMSLKPKSKTASENAVGYLRRFQYYDSELALLRAAARERPYCQFPPDRWTGAYVGLQGLVQYIGRISCARIATGADPIEDVLLTVRLATALTNSPVELETTSRLVQLSIQPIYDGIVAGRWSDSDLRAIQKAFAGINFMELYNRWVQQEARRFVAAVDGVTVRVTQMRTPMMGGVALPPGVFFGGGAVYTGGSTPYPVRDELPGKTSQRKADIIHYGVGQLPLGADGKTHSVQLGAAMLGAGGAEPILRDFQFAANQAINEVGLSQTAVDQVIVACALERFRLGNKNYPATLQQLVPAFCEKIPNDVVTRELPKYRLSENKSGYLLYSVGFDRVDDGGKPGNTPPGDWVWNLQRPAP